MTDVDYSYYTGTFLGNSIPETAFPRLMRDAQTYISRYTFGRADRPQPDDVTAKINNACCAVAELLQQEELSGGQIASEAVGKWSRTYVTNGKTLNQRVRDIVRRYLSGTGLTYRGVNAL